MEAGPDLHIRTSDPLVREVVAHLLRETTPLRVILFGSRATGHARPDSDIDLLVVLPEGTPRREAMVRLTSRLPVTDVDVDLLVATPETLRRHGDEPGLVYRSILRTGQTVFGAPLP